MKNASKPRIVAAALATLMLALNGCGAPARVRGAEAAPQSITNGQYTVGFVPITLASSERGYTLQVCEVKPTRRCFYSLFTQVGTRQNQTVRYEDQALLLHLAPVKKDFKYKTCKGLAKWYLSRTLAVTGGVTGVSSMGATAWGMLTHCSGFSYEGGILFMGSTMLAMGAASGLIGTAMGSSALSPYLDPPRRGSAYDGDLFLSRHTDAIISLKSTTNLDFSLTEVRNLILSLASHYRASYNFGFLPPAP